MKAKRLDYVPGFGGHLRRAHCKCSEADEYVCGVCHPDKHETQATIERRLRGAQVVAEREARISAWLGDLFGTGAEREELCEDPYEPYREPSKATFVEATTPRRDRELSKAEWAVALAWMRKQPLRRAEQEHREELAAQAWIELRTPPVSSTFADFHDELSKAWQRAKWAIRQEQRSARVRVRASAYDASGKKRVS